MGQGHGSKSIFLVIAGAGFADHDHFVDVEPGQSGFDAGFRVQKGVAVIRAEFLLKGKIPYRQIAVHRVERGQKNISGHSSILQDLKMSIGDELRSPGGDREKHRAG